LYEELNKCKELYNSLKLDNYRLKSKVQNLEEEIARILN
jgi:hypothetical protein